MIPTQVSYTVATDLGNGAFQPLSRDYDDLEGAKKRAEGYSLSAFGVQKLVIIRETVTSEILNLDGSAS
jgi:hypothetical protein